MNSRDFREELVQAFARGVEWSVQGCPSPDEVLRRGGIDSIIIAEGNKYASRRVIENANKLEPTL